MISNLPPDNLIVYVAWLPQFLRSFLNYSWLGIYWSCFRLCICESSSFFSTYIRTSQPELSIRIGMLNAKQSDYRHWSEMAGETLFRNCWVSVSHGLAVKQQLDSTCVKLISQGCRRYTWIVVVPFKTPGHTCRTFSTEVCVLSW